MNSLSYGDVVETHLREAIPHVFRFEQATRCSKNLYRMLIVKQHVASNYAFATSLRHHEYKTHARENRNDHTDETVNLAEQPGYAEVVAALHARWHAQIATR